MIVTKISLTLIFIIAAILARKGDALGLALAFLGAAIALEVLPQ